MRDDHRCGCDDVGALAYADDFDEMHEYDLVLDDPDFGPVLASVSAPKLGALEVIGDELIDLGDDELGWIDTAIKWGAKGGKALVDLVNAPAKAKAKQAQRKANAAQQQAAAAKAELNKVQDRAAVEQRQQEVMEQRRREQAHAQEKRALEDKMEDLRQQQILVRREANKRVHEAKQAQEKAAAEQQQKARTRKLAIGGGVAATSLIALWAFNRRPKIREDRREARR